MRGTIRELITKNKAQYELFKQLAEDKTVETSKIKDEEMLARLLKGDVLRINFPSEFPVVEAHSPLVRYVIKETFEIIKLKGFEPTEFPFGWEDVKKKDVIQKEVDERGIAKKEVAGKDIAEKGVTR